MGQELPDRSAYQALYRSMPAGNDVVQWIYGVAMEKNVG